MHGCVARTRRTCRPAPTERACSLRVRRGYGVRARRRLQNFLLGVIVGRCVVMELAPFLFANGAQAVPLPWAEAVAS